jgi:hypothetical protein
MFHVSRRIFLSLMFCLAMSLAGASTAFADESEPSNGSSGGGEDSGSGGSEDSGGDTDGGKGGEESGGNGDTDGGDEGGGGDDGGKGGEGDGDGEPGPVVTPPDPQPSTLTPPPTTRSDQARARSAATSGDIVPLSRVLEFIKVTYNSEVIDVKLRNAQSKYFYVVKIISADGRISQVLLNAKTLVEI